VASRWRRSTFFLAGRILPFVGAFVTVWVAAAVGFYFLEGGAYSLFTSVYWSIVTLGTVGYGDVVPTTTGAKLLTMGVIVVQLFLVGYLLTVVTTAVSEESERRALGAYGTELRDHIVVLGYSPVGSAAVRELLIQQQRVAVVTDRAEDVPNIRALGTEASLYVTYGPPADRRILERVNLPGARAVIACTPDDATNMIAVLNVRSINDRLRIVVSVGRPELRETLRTAGVTYVASPSDMGGRLCASAAFEPDVANAIDDFTAADIGADIQEYLVRSGSALAGLTFARAEPVVRRATGCILIGWAHPGPTGEFRTVVNPPDDTPLAAGDAIILIASIANAHRFRQWYGVEQGR
jgi:voltage-gated potassium channel